MGGRGAVLLALLMWAGAWAGAELMGHVSVTRLALLASLVAVSGSKLAGRPAGAFLLRAGVVLAMAARAMAFDSARGP